MWYLGCKGRYVIYGLNGLHGHYELHGWFLGVIPSLINELCFDTVHFVHIGNKGVLCLFWAAGIFSGMLTNVPDEAFVCKQF